MYTVRNKCLGFDNFFIQGGPIKVLPKTAKF